MMQADPGAATTRKDPAIRTSTAHVRASVSNLATQRDSDVSYSLEQPLARIRDLGELWQQLVHALKDGIREEAKHESAQQRRHCRHPSLVLCFKFVAVNPISCQQARCSNRIHHATRVQGA